MPKNVQKDNMKTRSPKPVRDVTEPVKIVTDQNPMIVLNVKRNTSRTAKEFVSPNVQLVNSETKPTENVKNVMLNKVAKNVLDLLPTVPFVLNHKLLTLTANLMTNVLPLAQKDTSKSSTKRTKDLAENVLNLVPIVTKPEATNVLNVPEKLTYKTENV